MEARKVVKMTSTKIRNNKTKRNLLAVSFYLGLLTFCFHSDLLVYLSFRALLYIFEPFLSFRWFRRFVVSGFSTFL